MIVVERAPPYLTIQDAGRPGYRASGLPPGGAMDQWSLSIANLLVGNERDAAGLEWAIGGGALRFKDDSDIAMAGADIEATLDGTSITTGQRIAVRANQLLTIQRIYNRRFVYLAISGGVDCPSVLGSRSTYLPAALGGIEGRRLRHGDAVLTGESRRDGESAVTAMVTDSAAPDYDAQEIRVVAAAGAGLAEFFGTSYTVSAASDRMGYRLEGNRALEAAGASITSEPVCAGVIQLPPNGQPIVLMADSPTVGGYRIIGTVITCDLPILSQCMPGRSVEFAAVSVGVARAELRRRESFLNERRARV